MSAADSLQQEPGHFCLPVKLGLGHSELLLGLGRAQCENVGQQQWPPPSFLPPLPAAPTPTRSSPLLLWMQMALPPGDTDRPLGGRGALLRPGALAPGAAITLLGPLWTYAVTSGQRQTHGCLARTSDTRYLATRRRHSRVPGGTVGAVSPQRGSDTLTVAPTQNRTQN